MSEYQVTMRGFEHITVEADSEEDARRKAKDRMRSIRPNEYEVNGPY